MTEELDHLIKQAQRARQLVGAVDLQKVAAHDPTERAKLKNVGDALAQIDAGCEVEHVEGVDDVLPPVDEALERRSRLLLLLDDAGYGDRIGRVLMIEDGKSVSRPLDLVPHTEGLPGYAICLACESATGTGAHALFVSESGVFAAAIATPFIKHHWRIQRSRPFDDDVELLATVEQFLSHPL